MPDSSIAGSLSGSDLSRWYLRSPEEIEQERRAAAARRHHEFFHGSSGSDPDHGSEQVTLTRNPAGTIASAPPTDQSITYGALRAPAPTDQDLAELRRQQAAFGNTTRKIDLQNSWLAAPVLAAPLAAMGLEGAAAWAARTALPRLEQATLQFVERDPYLRVGDNWATRAGRRAHAALEELVDSKPGWRYEPNVPRRGARPLKPDVGTPQRDAADLDRRYCLELKPNTPTGRAAAARAVKRYESATGQKARPIYYDPKDFI